MKYSPTGQTPLPKLPQFFCPLPPVPAGYHIPEDAAPVLPPANCSPASMFTPLDQIPFAPSLSQLADFTPFLGNLRIILLLYGGRRRPGDVAFFAEQVSAQCPTEGFRICVCVVDIVHGCEHDISRGALDFWLAHLHQNRIAAIGAAPPCETWSISRWSDGGWDDRALPVPLRHREALWGRLDLKPREHRQVRTANVLLMFTIAFATFSAFLGLHMWVEHPDIIARHARVGAPSIWYLEQMIRLRLLPVTRVFRVHHNDYGGTANKPTRLFAVRLPTLSRRLNQCLQRVSATLQLRGRDQFGNWRTSHAKEYPLRLSRALGHSMVDACRSFPLHNHAAEPTPTHRTRWHHRFPRSGLAPPLERSSQRHTTTKAPMAAHNIST